MSDALIGKVFGNSKIVAPLGQGGMASVYRAHQEAIDRTVALKVMPAEWLHEPNFLQRFNNEARALAKLQHPNILPLYDFGQANGMPYIIMPLMSGGTLADRIKRGPLPPLEVARIIAPIADALDYAHKQGLLHRDIKPNNILFDARDTPVLADFGIAKQMEGGAGLTGTAIIGTPDYMSPEQARGEQLDRQSDIYSLAVVVYHALTGKPLFQATTPMSVLFKHVTEQPRPLREMHPGLPPALEAVVMKSLAKNPADRHPTAVEFAHALAHAAAGPTKPLPAPVPTAPLVDRRTAPMPAVQPQPKKSNVGLWIGIVVGAIVTVGICLFVIVGLGGLGILGFGSAVLTEEAATLSAATAQANATREAVAAAATATALAQPINLGQTWPVHYADDFSADTEVWPIGDVSGSRATGTQSITDGVYFWNITATDSLHLRADLETAPHVSDFYLSVDVRQTSGPADADYGLVFRKVSDRSYYYFAVVDSGAFALYVLENNAWAALIELTETTAISPGQFNRLTLVGQSARFTFYLNDAEVAALDDGRFDSGTVGVAMQMNANQRGKFEYDNFELRAP